MSVKSKLKKRVRRQAAAASVFLPVDRGPAAVQSLVGRARVAEARRLVRRERDHATAEAVVAPLLDGVSASAAWSVLAESRARQGDLAGARAAAEAAVGARQVVFDALVRHHEVSRGRPEEAAVLAALLDRRPRHRRDVEVVLTALRTATVGDVERYAANLRSWGLSGWEV